MTDYIDIFATDIAIVALNITNASRYIGIATGQLRSARIKQAMATGTLRTMFFNLDVYHDNCNP